MLKVPAITPNEKTTEFGCLLAGARAEGRRREKSDVNSPIRALRFLSELEVYLAIYETLYNGKSEVREQSG